MSAIVVSLINLKGGVGKTTTTIQLAECLASEFSKRVLVIDLDPQTTATISLIDEDRWTVLNEAGHTIYHMFRSRFESTMSFDIVEAIQCNVSNLKLPKLSLLASSIDLIHVQDRMAEIAPKTGYSITPMEVLKQEITPLLDDYDYVLVDCPPNLGFITRNGIEISDFYLIPTIPDTLSTYGIPQIVKSIEGFRKERPSLKIQCMGLVMTKYYSRSESHDRGRRNLPDRFAQIFEDLEILPAEVFDTIIPLANTFADATLITNEPNQFKKKYGYGTSDGKKLHEYVTDLTKEFVAHAR